MVLMEKGGVCTFDENLKEVGVSFKTSRGVNIILVNLKGVCVIFPKK